MSTPEQQIGDLVGGAAGGVREVAEIDLSVCVMAMGAAFGFACLSEFLGWIMIYRHEEYKQTVDEVCDQQEKMEAMQEKM